MGKRTVPFLILALAVVAVAAATFIVLRSTARLGPERQVVVIDQPQAPPAAGKSVADFTVMDPPGPAPAAGFTDIAGQPQTLAAYRGRVVLLNLWATWCAPCVQEMPALDRLQAALGGPDFTVLALSQDRKGAEVVRPFLDKQGLKRLPVALDPGSEVSRALATDVLPASYLIDRQGRIVGRLVGAAEWDAPDWVALIRRTMAAPAATGS